MQPLQIKHRISAEMFKSRHATAPHPVFAIDGVSLDLWLSERVPGDWISGLVPAQGWLIDDADFALAWRKIERVDDGCSTIVPILICPDDVDLNCSVVVVEQIGSGSEIIWRRFGRPSDSRGDQCGTTVMWFETYPTCAFDLTEFQTTLADFKRLMGNEWK